MLVWRRSRSAHQVDVDGYAAWKGVLSKPEIDGLIDAIERHQDGQSLLRNGSSRRGSRRGSHRIHRQKRDSLLLAESGLQIIMLEGRRHPFHLGLRKFQPRCLLAPCRNSLAYFCRNFLCSLVLQLEITGDLKRQRE